MTVGDVSAPSVLLGGRSPRAFMKEHWQRRPLLVRQAVPGVASPVDRSALFALAAREDVDSRLVQRLTGDRDGADSDWSLRHGPFARRALPPLAHAGWTLLVQGVDRHVDAAHALLSRFRFVPDARLDDLMLSFATAGGGVGPHIDSYDVFLLQLHGRRRWQVGRVGRPALRPGLPLKILSNFVAEDEWVLDPGDMLYLPPNWAHDGVALDDCITASIGFRAATRGEFAAEVLQRLLDGAADDAADADAVDKQTARPARADAAAAPADAGGRAPAAWTAGARARYRDAMQAATDNPARVPPPLARYAADAVARLLATPAALDRALGEWLSEPPPQVGYDQPAALRRDAGLRLDRRTRMLYDDRHVFVNGESYRAGGRDARLLRLLADRRTLTAADVRQLSAAAWQLLQAWAEDGWLVADEPPPAPDPRPGRAAPPSAAGEPEAPSHTRGQLFRGKPHG